MVLEEIALDAVSQDGRLIARTSARRLAEGLGIDPGTAAGTLRTLRHKGLLVLERESGLAGRFGLAVYVIESVDGLTVVPPYDHSDVIAGQGTAALELLEDVGALDYFLAPCGGGGLLAGCALALSAMSPSCTIIGVARTVETFANGFTLVEQRSVSTVEDLDAAGVQDVLHSIYRPMRSRPTEAMRVTFALDLLLFRVV